MKTALKPLLATIALTSALSLGTTLLAADTNTNTATAARPGAAGSTNKPDVIRLQIAGQSIEVPVPEESAAPSKTVFGIPRDILDKMPPEEVAKLAQEQARMRAEQSQTEDTIIPIVAIVFVFGMPVFIVALVVYSRHRRQRLLHETIRTMIEKGVPIPPELLQPQQPRRLPKSDFRRGLVWSAIGLGWFIAFTVKGNIGSGALGLIPLLIGAAFLVTWKVESSKNGNNHS
jgi:hypothetical protein